ncbi:MAG: flavin reductase family protein [Elusimicrobia bacterium]|nr:flavin reductase family protein [Elusimicrobiota bacterium]
MELSPEELPLPERYRFLISVIQPRPIAWVSTQSPDGRHNLAPFSFFMGLTANPMSVCFAPLRNRQGRKKDTLINIEMTQQFVVNIATEDTAGKMNQSSGDYPYGVSEFEMASLTPVPSVKVAPPRVKESPVNLECELMQIVAISDGPLGGNLVIGKVIYLHVADRLWREGNISHQDLRAIGRLEDACYVKTSDVFQMPRPIIKGQ